MEKLIDLFQAKTAQKEFKAGSLTFHLKTLTTDELASVLRRADLESITPETKIFIAKRWTVAYSLSRVNGADIMALPEVIELQEKYTSKGEQRQKVDLLNEILGSFDAETIDLMYNCYNVIVSENNKKREELKKASVVL